MKSIISVSYILLPFLLLACEFLTGKTPEPLQEPARTPALTDTPTPPVGATPTGQLIFADSFFFGYAYIDANGDELIDPEDPPLEGALFTAVDAIGASAGGFTSKSGEAMAWWPADSVYPVTLRMEPPKDSVYTVIGSGVVVFAEEGARARFLFRAPSPTPESAADSTGEPLADTHTFQLVSLEEGLSATEIRDLSDLALSQDGEALLCSSGLVYQVGEGGPQKWAK